MFQLRVQEHLSVWAAGTLECSRSPWCQGKKYFKLKCRYLNYNSKLFGEAETSLSILEFRGAKRIDSLEVFPLRDHPRSSEIWSQLAQQGRRFVELMGVHHREYEGDAFIICKGALEVVKVKGRIMVDAGSFRDINPTYRKLCVNESLRQVHDLGIMFMGLSTTVSESLANYYAPMDLTEEDLLICSPTVMGYSLDNKMWCEYSEFDMSALTKHSGVCGG